MKRTSFLGQWLIIKSVSCINDLNFKIHLISNPKLDEAQADIKIAGRNINNLRYANSTTVLAESEEELKSFLMKLKRRAKKLA